MTAKISELASPTLPLAGTELIEMSQSGTSVKLTYDELLGGILSFDGTTLTVLGDIVVNDITAASETLRFGPGDGSISVSGGNVMNLLSGQNTVQVGTPEDTFTEGRLYLRGDDSNAGGIMRLYVGAGYDGTIDYYTIRALDDDLQIGPPADTDAIKYDGPTNSFQVQASGGLYVGDRTSGSGSTVRVGVDNHTLSDFGQLMLYAGTTIDGGTIRLFTGNAYDTTIDFYYMRAYEDSLAIGPATDWDALRYNGATNSWWAQATGGLRVGDQSTGSGSQIYVGVSDVGQQASLYLYGGNSQPGGSVYFYTGAPYDTTIDYYLIRPNEDDFEIGPATNTDALKYDGALNLWNFSAIDGVNVGDSATADGSIIRVGVDPPVAVESGKIYLYGGNSIDGGQARFYLGSPYDGTIDYYRINVTEDNWQFGPNTNGDALQYTGSTNVWNFTSGSVNIGVDDTVQGILNIYGASNSTDGGRLRLYSPVDSQDQDYFEIMADGGPFVIRNSSGESILGSGGGGTVSLGHTGNTTTISGTLVRTIAPLHVGFEDANPGLLHIHGHNTGTRGGRLLIYTSADYDDSTAIDYYEIQVEEDDLHIGPSTDPDSLKYVNADDIWDFTSGKVKITNMPSGATQVAAGVGIGELWRTSSHATLPDGVVMIGI